MGAIPPAQNAFVGEATVRPVPTRRDTSSLVWTAVVVCWLGAIAAGMGLLTAVKSTPGANAEAPHAWPSESALPRTPGRATLVMFAHPRCPCTRASLSELARLQARLPTQLSMHVAFMAAPLGEDWETDLQASARSIPGVTVSTDERGVEAARFGVQTSGQTLVYGAEGRLLFRGGITPSRGHEGDSVGRASIVSLVTGAQGGGESDVFGCSLVTTQGGPN